MKAVLAGGQRAEAPSALPTRPDEKRAMARWLSVMWAAGVIAGIGTPLMPQFQLLRPEIDVAIGVASIPLMIACLWIGDRMTPRLAGVMLALGLLVICLAIYSVGPTANVYAGCVYALWIPLYAAMFFTRRVAHLWLAATLVAVTVTLASYGRGEMLPIWLNTTLTVSIASVVVERLASRNRVLALQDGLTGLPNRRFFDQMLGILAAAAERSGRPLALVSIDLDGFKQVNDQHGHAAGDALLVRAAEAWSAQTRRSDLLARVGGDEFAVLLPDTDSASAQRLVQRMRESTPDVPFSAGVATWDGHGSVEQLLAEGDRLLYADKASRSSDRAAD